MFQTYESAKYPIFWKDVDECVYSYAELMVNSSWFYADCKLTDGVETVTSTYLLSMSSQIKDLINNPGVSIKSIYLVSPPYLNRTGCWSMSPLARISVGKVTYEDYENNIEIYELKSGEIIYSSSEIDSHEKIEDIKVVYS
jgi:hypothetical protein